MSSSRKCANNPYTSAATPQIKDTTLINCDTILENMQSKRNLDRLYLDFGQLCQSDKTCTNCCKDNVHSDAFGKIIMAFFAVSRTPLSHCILKQLLGNPRNCKNIIDFTQSYHSGKATRQATYFYNTIIRIESQSVSVRAIQDIIQCLRRMYNVKGHSWGRVKLDTTQRGGSMVII